ncbi:MAG TPA: SCP2 sterol-binding domain-containing protein [Candidatus Obscuribacterales bacterium]
MAYFSSTDELNRVMDMLWHKIKSDPGMSHKLLESKLIVQFKYRDPDGLLTIDCSSGQDMDIIIGTTTLKPVVEMSMKADVAHEFWLGKVNVPLAIMSGKIVSKGPTPKALALLPVIKPAYALYPQVLQEAGKKTA